MLTDAETGSTWDGLAGRAVAGPLAGEQLEWVKSTASFWFGWKDWYPETRVYGEDEWIVPGRSKLRVIVPPPAG